MRKPTLRVISISILLFFVGGAVSPLRAGATQSPTQKERDWELVRTLLEEANNIKHDRDARRRGYLVAAKEFVKWFVMHVKDEGSVEYVNAAFHLGITWESAGAYEKAEELLEQCDHHKMRNHPRAKYKGGALAPQIKGHLEAVRERLHEIKIETQIEIRMESRRPGN
jgi:hypothetical protein